MKKVSFALCVSLSDRKGTEKGEGLKALDSGRESDFRDHLWVS
jgi:hypothetical protein